MKVTMSLIDQKNKKYHHTEDQPKMAVFVFRRWVRYQRPNDAKASIGCHGVGHQAALLHYLHSRCVWWPPLLESVYAFHQTEKSHFGRAIHKKLHLNSKITLTFQVRCGIYHRGSNGRWRLESMRRQCLGTH